MREFQASVVSNHPIAEGIRQMDFVTEPPVPGLAAGKFVNLSLDRPDMLLKRPFGLFSFSEDGRKFSICYQLVGKGTEYMSTWEPGRLVTLTGPLGNGFELGAEMKKVALIGGGVGIFPLHSLRFSYPDRDYAAFIGFRNEKVACHRDSFSAFAHSYFSTDDGSFGDRGNAVDLYLRHRAEFAADVVLACGPTVMLSALKRKFTELGIRTRTFVSTEERMGCGVGACLVCVCGKKDGDGMSKNVRVCRDGPVFDLWEVEL